MKFQRFSFPALIAFCTSFTFLSSSVHGQQSVASGTAENAHSGGQIIRNGFFADNTQHWQIEQISPAKGEFVVTDEGPDGARCARVRLLEPGDEHWKMSLLQTGFGVRADKRYRVSFMAKGSVM